MKRYNNLFTPLEKDIEFRDKILFKGKLHYNIPEVNNHSSLTGFNRITDFRNLLDAYKKASQGKKDKKYVIDFREELEEKILQIKEELENGTYKWSGYYTFEISDSKKRIIAAPVFRDRIVHHAVCNIIEPIFDRTFIAQSYACRKGKGTLAGVKLYEKYINTAPDLKYVLQCDVKKYFPSVNHQVLYNLITKKIKDKKLLKLLYNLINFNRQDKGLPIGSLTSQLFANIYLNRLDHYLKENLGVKYYLRYMDDFLIIHSSKEYLQNIRQLIDNFLKEKLLLTLHPNKQHIYKIDKGIKWLGYVVFRNYYKRIRRRNVINFQKRLKQQKKDLKLNIISAEKIHSSIASWIGFSKHADSFKLNREILLEQDAANIGKYHLCRTLKAENA